MTALFFVISFLASVAGAICGIGGGVIIKPTLDLFHLASVSTVSFLSGCTVLAMSCYSVGRALAARDSLVNLRTGTPLGRQLFAVVKGLFANQNTVGAVQAACLLVVTLGTLVYTLQKARIKTLRVKRPAACTAIGLGLGLMSSFLGIGGGPINLVVLYYFFSMDTKTAAQNSLYIILFSQLASLAATLATGSVPEFAPPALVLMIAGGVLGGMAGRAVEKLFILLMLVIVGISCYNTYFYAVQ